MRPENPMATFSGCQLTCPLQVQSSDWGETLDSMRIYDGLGCRDSVDYYLIRILIARVRLGESLVSGRGDCQDQPL